MKNLLSSSSGHIIGSNSLANSGKSKALPILSLLSSAKFNYKSWILDSGATDHMYDSFVSYEPSCSSIGSLLTVYGTMLTVDSKGSLRVEPISLLTHLLHVPKLLISLVSVQNLLNDKKLEIL